jgi:hypothetical protein
MAGRDVKFKVKLLDQSVQDLELDAFVSISGSIQPWIGLRSSSTASMQE